MLFKFELNSVSHPLCRLRSVPALTVRTNAHSEKRWSTMDEMPAKATAKARNEPQWEMRQVAGQPV